MKKDDVFRLYKIFFLDTSKKEEYVYPNIFKGDRKFFMWSRINLSIFIKLYMILVVLVGGVDDVEK